VEGVDAPHSRHSKPHRVLGRDEGVGVVGDLPRDDGHHHGFARGRELEAELRPVQVVAPQQQDPCVVLRPEADRNPDAELESPWGAVPRSVAAFRIDSASPASWPPGLI